MRIYAVSDIHGHPDRLARIQQNAAQHSPDVLVVAGDIASYLGHRSVLSRLNDLGLPVLVVRGNTDRPLVDRMMEPLSRTQSLHLRETVLGGIPFTGVSGTIPVPFRSRLRWRERPVLEQMASLVKGHSVLVAHPPPWGTLDEVLGGFHAGCMALREIVLEQQPRLLICGHIHERAGTVRLGRTLVVNCNMARARGGALIDLISDCSPRVRML